MSYTEKDAELWETDPYEYIRVKVKICKKNQNPFLVKTCGDKHSGEKTKIVLLRKYKEIYTI